MASIGHLGIATALTIAVFDLAVSQRWIAAERANASSVRGGDNICGPRCVHVVLRYYGHASDLVEIVRELQFPDIERGASLAEMRRVLEREGLYTAPFSVHPGYYCDWPHPIIAHIERPGHLGHYIVIVADGADRERLKEDGIADVRAPSDPELLGSSYTVLATAPAAFFTEDARAHVRFEGDGLLLSFSLLILGGLAAIVWSPPRLRPAYNASLRWGFHQRRLT